MEVKDIILDNHTTHSCDHVDSSTEDLDYHPRSDLTPSFLVNIFSNGVTPQATNTETEHGLKKAELFNKTLL